MVNKYCFRAGGAAPSSRRSSAERNLSSDQYLSDSKKARMIMHQHVCVIKTDKYDLERGQKHRFNVIELLRVVHVLQCYQDNSRN
jgi:hypothetical protein